MAKLLPPFILCPLSENKEFLGMSSDSAENKVILTIGKNIAIRYHVLEQKQEVSWISSRHWFTSRVIFCPDLDKYGAVIDSNTVITFDESDSNLGSMKKYKFNKPVSQLKTTRGLGTLVIFKNGAIKPLVQLMELKKKTGSLELKDLINNSEETLLYTEIDEKRSEAVLAIGSNSEVQTIAKCGIEKLRQLKIIVLDISKIRQEEPTIKFSTTIQEEQEFILGSTLLISYSSNSVIYMCSNGYLYMKSLGSNFHQSKDEHELHEEELRNQNSFSTSKPTKVAKLDKYISTSAAIVIKSLDSSSVLIYGCDASEEGAVVLVYDVNYNILLTKQSLKLYSTPPMMEQLGAHIFVPVGLHILVLNLRRSKARLSSVVGKHQIQDVDLFEKRDPWIQSWSGGSGESKSSSKGMLTNGHSREQGDDEEMIMTSTKSFTHIYNLVKTLESDGQPESMICGQIIPQVLETENMEAITWTLNYFYDIPESLITAILALLLSNLEDFPGDTGEAESTTSTTGSSPSCPLINQILLRHCDRKQLVHEFRTLDFSLAKKFLRYLCQRTTEAWSLKIQAASATDDIDEPDQSEFLSQLLSWTSILYDAQYTHFVFNNETELIDSHLKFINDKLEELNEIGSLEPLLGPILAKISYEPKPPANMKYRVETVLFE